MKLILAAFLIFFCVSYVTSKKDICERKQPCKNGGTCIVKANNKFTCDCPEGVVGKYCKCVTNDCQATSGPNAYCGLNKGKSGQCQCKKGYKFDKKTKLCKDPVCEYKNPCQNGGTCTVTDPQKKKHTCDCPEGVIGKNCGCADKDCQAQHGPNSYCGLNSGNSGQCQCKEGYKLDKKTKKCKNICEMEPRCQNGGKCVPMSNKLDVPPPYRYTCECPEKVTGYNCECSAKKCNARQPNTECTKSAEWYKPSTCKCKAGYPLNTKTKTCDACGPPKAMKWCALSCKNTMCVYQGRNPDCPIFDSAGPKLSTAVKQSVVDAHNKLRQKVARGNEPGLPAANKTMPNLVWDDGLAEVALRWLGQCIFDHDPHRGTPKFPNAGQNLYVLGRNGKPTFTEEYPPHTRMVPAVYMWYSEVDSYVKSGCNPNSYSKCPRDFGQVGHFTAVIWQKTTHVGCAYAWMPIGSKYKCHVACNYGPAGNYRGAAVYA